MSVRIALGTKEFLFVDVVDSTGVTTSLAAATPKFDVLDAADVVKINQSTPTITNMRLQCLVDASNTTTFPVGTYRLFVDFVVGSEEPRLGPFTFMIVDEEELF
jgi:hypothetical protein